MSQFHQNFITTVIDRYGLELDGHQVDTITANWFHQYDPIWIVKAIVESLYRGRYKIKSVDNILRDWQRLGKPRYDFTAEYEREILQNLPELNDAPETEPSPTLSPPVDPPDPIVPVMQTAVYDSKNLNPEELAPLQHNSFCFLADRSIHGAIVNEEDICAIANLPADNGNLARSIPPSASEMLDESVSSLDREIDNANIDRQISLPVKYQLYNTLKAIVDPKNQPQAEVDRSESTRSHTENPDSSRIAIFPLPIDNNSEEQQV